ncbi:MAG: HAD-IIIA family hydrolase [Chlorobium sp.]|nr:HAD-IIIA family hydrolase [Chlorobium phaeovibrioides]NQU46324.1 HAD-IIIA family hydrolase [Chlorobium sp.]
MSEKIRVLFLDRDGTINEDTGSYIAENHQLKIIPGAAEAMALARAAGFRIVIVTNQAGIARGIATVEQVEEVNRYLNELLAPHEATYDSCYYCPSHPLYPHPEYDQYKDFRKPATGMVDRAIADFRAEGYEVDRSASFFVGDKMIDVECGIAASLRSILVRTGHNEEEICREHGIVPEFVADNLYQAVTSHILA